MSSNIIGPSPKYSVAPSDKLQKSSENLDDIEKLLITTIDTVEKKGNQNKMWWRNPTLLLFKKKNKTDTVEKKGKSKT